MSKTLYPWVVRPLPGWALLITTSQTLNHFKTPQISRPCSIPALHSASAESAFPHPGERDGVCVERDGVCSARAGAQVAHPDGAGLLEAFLISWDTLAFLGSLSPPSGSSGPRSYRSPVNWWPPALRQINPARFEALWGISAGKAVPGVSPDPGNCSLGSPSDADAILKLFQCSQQLRDADKETPQHLPARCGWALVRTGDGLQWGWLALGVVRNGAGLQWRWFAMGLVRTGAGAERAGLSAAAAPQRAALPTRGSRDRPGLAGSAGETPPRPPPALDGPAWPWKGPSRPAIPGKGIEG